jgi:hypothetical protein
MESLTGYVMPPVGQTTLKVTYQDGRHSDQSNVKLYPLKEPRLFFRRDLSERISKGGFSELELYPSSATSQSSLSEHPNKLHFLSLIAFYSHDGIFLPSQ